MRATDRQRRARRSQFVPRCATPRWVTCWLLALAGCLNPIPDTDPSVDSNNSSDDSVGVGPPAAIDQVPSGAGSDGEFSGEPETNEPAPPVTEPPVPGGLSPDAGAPSADAGADAGSGGLR